MCEQGQGLEARLLVQKWPHHGLDGLPPQKSFLGSGSCKRVGTWCPTRHG